jgi:hypothetical protein
MPEATPTNSDTAIGCLILLVLAAAIGGLAWWVAPDKYAYALEYSVDSENVFVEKKPKTCDWEHAPMGDKGCHFNKVVTTQKDQTGKVTSVYVSWEKVED